MDPKLQRRIWTALLAGESLDSFALPVRNGRVDLRSLNAPPVDVSPAGRFRAMEIAEMSGMLEVRKVHWRDLDFEGAALQSMRFFDSTVANCSFARADCRDWRAWGTCFSRCDFRGADLKDAGLGGDKYSPNRYSDTDFSRADLRRTAHFAAKFDRCRFANSKLSKVIFNGSVFEDCRFEGTLQEVEFYRHAFGGEDLPPNEMTNVDFRSAKLLWVEFRELDMDAVIWPEGEDAIVMADYRATLERLIGLFQDRNDLPMRQLVAVLTVRRRWAGAHQKEGFISKDELRQIGGEALVVEFLRACGDACRCSETTR